MNTIKTAFLTLAASALAFAASVAFFGLVGIAEGSDCLCSQWLTAIVRILIPA